MKWLRSLLGWREPEPLYVIENEMATLYNCSAEIVAMNRACHPKARVRLQSPEETEKYA